MGEYTLDQLSNEEIEKLLADGFAEEIAKTHALGLPTTHADKYGIYDMYPDGSKVYFKLYSEDNKEKEETV